jgi:hypothetical protein
VTIFFIFPLKFRRRVTSEEWNPLTYRQALSNGRFKPQQRYKGLNFRNISPFKLIAAISQ